MFNPEKFTDPRVDSPDPPEYHIPSLPSIECNTAIAEATLDSIPVPKACWPGEISAHIIYECRDVFVVTLTKIFGQSPAQGMFLTRWKQSNVLSILEKGCPKDPRNYRSVSLIPLFGKGLLTRERPVLSPTQHGFVAGHSCT